MGVTLTGQVGDLTAMLDDPLNIIIVHLAKNIISNDVDAVLLADFVECNFPGYTPQRVLNCIPFVSDDPTYGQAISPEIAFVADAIVVPQLITAVYVTFNRGSAATALMLVDIFASPQSVSENNQTFLYNLNFELLDDEPLSD